MILRLSELGDAISLGIEQCYFLANGVMLLLLELDDATSPRDL